MPRRRRARGAAVSSFGGACGSRLREAELRPCGLQSHDQRFACLLRLVGIEAAAQKYPHQLSGGMRQRAVIAMALALDPDLIILDEPTTALDVVVQRDILQQIEELQSRLGFSMLFITHDLSLLIEISTRLAVMYAGRIVESGSTRQIFKNPQHPYTWSLLRSIPRIDEKLGGKLLTIKGLPPDLTNLPPGCKFHPRCRFTVAKCFTDAPDLFTVGPQHESRCWVQMDNVADRDAALRDEPLVIQDDPTDLPGPTADEAENAAV